MIHFNFSSFFSRDRELRMGLSRRSLSQVIGCLAIALMLVGFTVPTSDVTSNGGHPWSFDIRHQPLRHSP